MKYFLHHIVTVDSIYATIDYIHVTHPNHYNNIHVTYGITLLLSAIVDWCFCVRWCQASSICLCQPAVVVDCC